MIGEESERKTMIRELMKDPLFLSQPCRPCTKKDLPLAQDLKDTILHYKNGCLGMAANMIGEQKTMIVVLFAGTPMVLINPKIVSRKNPYNTKEGCLCLSGERETKRYIDITVEYLDEDWQKHRETYTNLAAEVLQHEIDHCNGIMI